MSHNLILSLLLILPFTLNAQNKLKNLDLKPGQITLNNHEMLQGEIAYDVQKEKLVFKNEQQVRLYQLSDFYYFNVYDRKMKMLRHYGVYKNQHGKLGIYEQIVVGHCHFLRQPDVFYTQAYYPHLGRLSLTTQVNSSQYFLAQGQQVEKIKSFKKQLQRIFNNSKESLKELAKTENLNLNSPRDQAKLVFALNKRLKVKDESKGYESKSEYH